MSEYKQQSNRNIQLHLTYIKSEGKFLKFYSLPEHALGELRKVEHFFLEKEKELDAESGFMRNFQITPGSQCCVKSQVKNHWCRARVLPIDVGLQKVVVTLLDYGNIEVVPISDVRRADTVTTIPPLAIECILADVAPSFGSEWSPEAVSYCEQHLLYQTLSGYIVTEFNGIPVVRVAKLGETEPFVQRLINSGLAKIESLEPNPKSDVGYSGKGYKFLPLEANTTHLVNVSYVYSPRLFYIRLSPAENELKNLMESIERCVNHEPLSLLTTAAVGMPCLAFYNKAYYRALIRGVQQGVCKVMLIDCGIVLNKDMRELLTIPSHFLSLAAQAIACSLHESSQLSSENFVKIIKKYQYLTCQVLGKHNETYVVNLMYKAKNIASLISSGSSPVPNSYTIQPLTAGLMLEVTVTYVVSPQEFYCQVNSFKKDLDLIVSKLEAANGFEVPNVASITPGMPLCAKFSVDGQWYRAEVISMQDGYVEVFFVDYGNSDKVALQDTRIVPSTLLKHPVHGHKFSLHGCAEATLTDDLAEWFEETLMENNMSAEIRDIQNEVYSVVLYEENSNISVNEKLEGKQSQTVLPLYPEVSDIEVVCVTNFDPPVKFFGQLTKFDLPMLTDLQESISSFCNKQNLSVPQVKVGDLVCARFSEDKQFYRAIVESLNNSQCSVLFMDYGNRDVVSLSDIQKMNAQFMKYPFFGIECTLDNCPATVNANELQSLLLDAEVQIKLLKQLSPGKWQVKFTESFPGNAKILALLCPQKISRTPSLQDSSVQKVAKKEPENFASSSKGSKTWPVENRPNDIVNQDLEDFDDVSVPSGSYKEIYVSYVVSPSEFYCQIVSESLKLQQLMEKINQVYRKFGPNDARLENLKEGASCCVLHQEDLKWYRAKVKMCRGQQCEVFFVDYGNTEVVLQTKLKALLPEFFAVCPQALQCAMYNVVPDGEVWSEKSKKASVEMLNKKSFIAKFEETRPKGIHIVSLMDINKLQEGVLSKNFVEHGYGQVKDPNKLLTVEPLVASTSLKYLVPEIELPSKENIVITWVADVVHFFCQLSKSLGEFESMMNKMQQHYMQDAVKKKTTIDRFHTGMISVAQFSQDGAWYRAKIGNVQKNAVHVYYVDYGNQENVEKQKVKYIDQDFLALPVLAVKCRLRGLEPNVVERLPDSFPSLFEGNAECAFFSKEKDYYLVDLICNGKNVAHEIVNMQLATSTLVAADNNANVKDQPAIPALSGFRKDQLVNVIVSYVDSPAKFWCQLEDNAEALEKLMADIETCCTTDGMELKSPVVGCSCLAKYSDNCWYRAEIKQLLQDGQCEVFFVDYGNSEVVKSSEMIEIPADFLSLPAQAIQCQLHRLPRSFEKENEIKFRELVENASELMAKIENIHGRTYTVTLFDSSDAEVEVNILEAVFGTGITDSHPQFLKPEVPAGEHPGYISAVSNPSDFYIQLVSIEATLQDLADQISEKYQSEDYPQVDAVSPGIICCAKYTKDGEWYRAEVIDVKGDDVIILLVDYGSQDTVSVSSLRDLDPDFLKVPLLAIPCSLGGVSPRSEWSEAAIKKMEEFMDDAVVDISFVEASLPAVVCIKREGVNLSEELEKLEVTDEQQSSSIPPGDKVPSLDTYPKRVITDSTLSARICFVESSQKFFITATDWLEELDSLMAELESYNDPVQESSLSLSEVHNGQCCAAKYSEDGVWYRAIVSNVSGEEILVSFIDYGNTETTNLQNLLCLKPEFFNYPPFAVPCCLADDESFGNEDCDKLEKLQFFCDEAVDLKFKIDLSNKPYVVHISTIEDGNIPSTSAEAITNQEESRKEQSMISSEDIPDLDIRPQAEYPKPHHEISKFMGTISFVENWNEFYITRTDSSEKLAEVMTLVKKQYEEDSNLLAVSSVQKFEPCVAKYSEDECWYRAIVVDVDSDNIFLQFIDYGNSEMTTLSEIRKITPELLNIPPFALKCHLSHFTAEDSAKDAIVAELQILADEAADVEIEVVDFSDSSYSVKIRTDVDFITDLIEKKLGHSFENDAELDKDTDIESEPVVVSSDHTESDMKFPDRKLKVGKLEARICFVESWSKFFVTSTMWEKEFLIMSAILKNTDLVVLSSDDVCVGLPCIYEDENKDLHRVVVTAVNPEGIDVLWVDVGSSYCVEAENLKQTSPEILSIPVFAVECKLHELLPSENAEADILEKIDELRKEKIVFELEVCVLGSPYEVKIKTDCDFSAQLVQEGLAVAVCQSPERLHDRETFKDNLKIAFVDHISDEMTKYSVPGYLLPKEEMTGFLQHCEIIDHQLIIYVVSVDLMASLEELQSELQEMYNKAAGINIAFLEGDYCVAKFPLDNCWYRAQVLQKMGETVLVKSIDYGSTEEVPVENIKKLALEFSEAPQFAIECCISGIWVSEEHAEAVENSLLELKNEWKIKVCPMSSHKFGNQTCISRVEAAEINVIEHLVNANLAKQIFPPSRDLKVFHCDFIDIDKDCTIHLVLKDSLGKRAVIQDSLASAYDSIQPCVHPEVTTTQLYVVSKDSLWYRAVVCSVHKDTAVVYLVDFGLYHTAHASDLYLLLPDFAHLSTFSVQCRLHGLPSNLSFDIQQEVHNILQHKDLTSIVDSFDHSHGYYYVRLSVDGKDVLEQLLHCESVNQNYTDSDKLEKLGGSEKDGSSFDDNYIQQEATVATADDDHQNTHSFKSNHSDSYNTQIDLQENELITQETVLLPCEAVVEEQGQVEAILEKESGVEAILKKESGVEAECKEHIETSVEEHDQIVAEDEGHFETDVEDQHVEVDTADKEDGQLEGNLETQDAIETSFKEPGQVDADNKRHSEADVEEQCDVVDAKVECDQVELSLQKQDAKDTVEEHSPVDEGYSEANVEKQHGLADTIAVDHGLVEACPEKYVESSLKQQDGIEGSLEKYEQVDAEDKGNTDVDEHQSQVDTINEHGQIREKDNQVDEDFGHGQVNTEYKDHNHGVAEIKEGQKDAIEDKSDLEITEHCQVNANCHDEKLEKAVSPVSSRCGDSSPVGSDLTDQNKDELFENQIELRKRTLLPGDNSVTVFGVKVENSKLFLAVIPVDCHAELLELQTDLQKYYMSETKINICEEVGPCAILSKDDIWHRGEVTQFGADGMASVSYWDTPLLDATTPEFVRKLAAEFSSQPPFVVWCTIPGVRCSEAKSVEPRLQAELLSKDVSLKVLDDEDVCAVKLIDKEDVLQQLIEEGLLTYEANSCFLPSGDVSVIISHFDESAFSIYLQIADQVPHLEQLQARMTNHFTGRSNAVMAQDAVNAGLYAAVHNGAYERCNVLKQDTAVLLYFVDSGECKEAGDVQLEHLVFDFAFDPPYAYPCHISNLCLPSDDKACTEVLSTLKEVSLQNKLKASFAERGSDGFYPVQLTVDGQDVLEWLKYFNKSSDDLKAALKENIDNCVGNDVAV